MTTVVVVAGDENPAVVRAFREETDHVVVVDAGRDVDQLMNELIAVAPSAIVAASPSATSSVRALHAVFNLADPLGSLPHEREIAAESGNGDTTRLSVAMVSRAGKHVSAGVYENSFYLSDGRERLRGRISLPYNDELALAAESAARAYLDDFGVREGATTVEVHAFAGDATAVDAGPGVLSPSPAADASFRAFGHSHEHLLAESVLRPGEFERRLVRPLQPGRTTLAFTTLRLPKPGTQPGAAALRLVRRLTGFYSLGLAGATADRSEVVLATATFVHSDRASVANSLRIIAQIEDADIAFVENYQVIGLAPRAS